MSKSDKLINRFKKVPKDLTWDEFVKLMAIHGYRLSKGQGSKRKFINDEKNLIMIFHEPHPQSIMKQCYIRQVIKAFDEYEVW